MKMTKNSQVILQQVKICQAFILLYQLKPSAEYVWNLIPLKIDFVHLASVQEVCNLFMQTV